MGIPVGAYPGCENVAEEMEKISHFWKRQYALHERVIDKIGHFIVRNGIRVFGKKKVLEYSPACMIYQWAFGNLMFFEKIEYLEKYNQISRSSLLYDADEGDISIDALFDILGHDRLRTTACTTTGKGGEQN